jgi:hypothetical protein
MLSGYFFCTIQIGLTEYERHIERMDLCDEFVQVWTAMNQQDEEQMAMYGYQIPK